MVDDHYPEKARGAGGLRAVERCQLLGSQPYSASETGLFRGYLTPAYAASQAVIAEWMRDAGMSVRVDAAANLVGTYPGAANGPPLIIGSHLDSVRDAGVYDGPLGIMLGIECVAALHADGRQLPFPIEVYAFGDEEGSRFPAAMLTSRAVVGEVDPACLELTDSDGVSLAGALAAHVGSINFADARHGPALAYLEAHIEQGPVLEAMGGAVGTVTAIAAQKRFSCRVTGMAGHAGTTVMPLRRDALTAAAAMILAIEEVARSGPADLVATVGRIDALPGAANVVPGAAMFTVDVRAGTNAVRDAGATAILAACDRIAEDRGATFASQLVQDLAASPCDPALIDMMDLSVASAGEEPARLVSGAGHDAMILADLCPTAMLFIRCRDGISHNPAEHVEAADADIALAVMRDFLERLAGLP
jgi:allantoate deiminase